MEMYLCTVYTIDDSINQEANLNKQEHVNDGSLKNSQSTEKNTQKINPVVPSNTRYKLKSFYRTIGTLILLNWLVSGRLFYSNCVHRSDMGRTS